jgi:pyridoxamine 5'-phosphate oxidase family protein
MSFTPAEVAYLEGQPLARLSTTDEHGQPDVVPLAFQLDGTHIWIGGSGDSFLATRKVRNIKAGRRDVALVVDDMPSFDPFIARGIRIYGRADDPIERVGLVGPGWYVRIVPTVSWSWNLRGDPVGDEWYPASRTDHRTTTGEA